MPRFRVQTTDAETGEEFALEVEATDPQGAMEQAGRLLSGRRVSIGLVQPLDPSKPHSVLTREDHDRLLSTICLGVLSALLIFLLVSFLIAWVYHSLMIGPNLEPFP